MTDKKFMDFSWSLDPCVHPAVKITCQAYLAPVNLLVQHVRMGAAEASKAVSFTPELWMRPNHPPVHHVHLQVFGTELLKALGTANRDFQYNILC